MARLIQISIRSQTVGCILLLYSLTVKSGSGGALIRSAGRRANILAASTAMAAWILFLIQVPTAGSSPWLWRETGKSLRRGILANSPDNPAVMSAGCKTRNPQSKAWLSMVRKLRGCGQAQLPKWGVRALRALPMARTGALLVLAFASRVGVILPESVS